MRKYIIPNIEGGGIKKKILVLIKIKRFGGTTVEKKLTIYLAKLLSDKKLVMTEHSDYKWIDYSPPHTFEWPPGLNKLFEKVLEFQKEGKLEPFLNRLK